MELTKEFGDILMDFFIKYDKKHKRKVKKLVVQFSGRENGCLIALSQRYNIDPSTLDGFLLSKEEKAFYKPKEEQTAAISSDSSYSDDSNDTQVSETSEVSDSDDISTEQSSGKKKKKLLIIVAIAALLVLGVGGAMLFLGGDATAETNTEVEGTAISDDVEIFEQTQEQTIISDSSETDTSAVNDSTLTDSTTMNDSTPNQDSLSNPEADTNSQATE